MTRLGTPGYKQLRGEYNTMFDGHVLSRYDDVLRAAGLNY